jgi:benzoate membrane transport protein
MAEPALAAPASRDFWRDLSPTHATNGLVAFLFAATGPVAVILATGTKGGLNEADLASWIFGSFGFSGVISVGYCLGYRQPLVYFWSIPGAVLVGSALGHLTFAQVIGAYILTGLLMIALGVTGWVRRAMRAVPMPIVMAMVAGVFLSFGLDWVRAFRADVGLTGAMTIAYLAVSALPRVAARLPPLVVAMAVGAAVIAQFGTFAPALDQTGLLAAPVLHAPEFSWVATAELVVPLAITVLVVQNGQGFAILTAAGHDPPINSIAIACGVGSIAGALVGAVSTCLTGPVSAIISANDDRPAQYTAGVVVGALAIVFGLLSPLFTRLLLATPPVFIATLAGLAMLRVLQGAFTIAFQGRFALGALVTFLVTVADIAVFNIGAAFWGLVAGMGVSLMLERADWRAEAGAAG